MGISFYTLQETQQRLHKARSSIFNYANKGFIKKYLVNDRVMFSKEEVDDLAQRMGSDAPAMTRAAWLEMQGRLRKLEEEMVTVKHILELRSEPPLRPGSEAGKAIYSAMQTYLASPSSISQQGSIENWANIFETTDEKTLDLLSEFVGDKAIWVTMFRTCTSLMEFSQSQNEASPSLSWQSLAQRLDHARQKLRSVSLSWLESGRGSIPADLLSFFDTKKEVLVHRLCAKVSAS